MPRVEATGKLLKGSDLVKEKRKAVGGVIMNVRVPAAGFGSPYIVEFDADVLPGIHQWPVNRTEATKLSEMIDPYTEQWPGWAVVLGLCERNDPKKNKPVPSLEVVKVVDPKTAKKDRKTKPMYTATPSGETVEQRVGPTPNWDDVPF